MTEAALIDTAGIQVSIAVNAAHADIFLAGTGHTSEKLLDLHRANQPLPRFPLKGKIRATIHYKAEPITSTNVVGVLPGASDEAIVISAHLDHLGVGAPIGGDPIYNGAMDNASGVASVIEVARNLSKQKLNRTVVFLAVTGEEGGLMGSRHFAAHPSVPASKIVANVNLDMFLPIIPLKAITVYGMDESDLGQEFAGVASKFQIRAERDPEPARNLFIRSDQYSFIRKGVPALTFKFHPDPNSAEAKVMKEWLRVRYHAPSDDLSQPVNVEGATQFNRVMTAFIQQVANRPGRPQWKQESFFRRYERAD